MSECGDNLEFLVKTIVSSLVDKPDEVRVTTTQGVKTHILEVQVAKDDVGKVIGRQGMTAGAIRVILNNAAGKQKVNALLQIVEPDRDELRKKVA